MIKEITFLEAYTVRHPVLRPNKPIETCHFEGDELKTTTHFGYFDNQNLVGIISVFFNSNIFFQGNQFQIRGMAVLSEHQKKGFGAKLVVFAEKYVCNKNANLIWFNARIVAVPFYEKLGYQKIGTGFEIGDIGLHFVMFKNVTKIL